MPPKPVAQHNHSVADLPIGVGSGRIPTYDMVLALIGSAAADFVVLRPSAPDPSLGVYATWAEAHAAARVKLAAGQANVVIWFDSPTAIIPGEAGTYDMQGVSPIGVLYPDQNAALPAGQHVFQTAVGCFFTNWVTGNPNIALSHNGTAALCTFTYSGTLDRVFLNMGERASWTTANAGAPVMSILLGTAVSGSFRLAMPDLALVFGGAAGTPIISVESGITIQVNLQGGVSSFQDNSLSGPVGSTVEYLLFPGVPASVTTQVDFLGTVQVADYASSVPYTPALPANWVGTDPANVKQALDRLAAYCATIGGGPVPS